MQIKQKGRNVSQIQSVALNKHFLQQDSIIIQTLVRFTKEIWYIWRAGFMLILLLLMSKQELSAQQLPQFTQYMFNQLNYNPAYAGSKSDINIESAFRFQWVGVTDFEGIPLTQNVGVHLPIPLFRGGVGLQVVNDMLGAERNTAAYLSYAFIQPIGRTASIAIGVRAGMIQKALDGTKLISPTGTYTDGSINHNDALISAASVGGFTPDFGAGIYLKAANLAIGLATQHLLEPSVTLSNNTTDVAIQYKRHLTLNAHYDILVGKSLVLTPAALVKTDLNKYQVEMSALATINENIIAGLSFRGIEPNSFDAASLLLGTNLSNGLRLIYSYDYPISGLRDFTSGSHEITIHYTLRKILPSSKGKTIHNPRFL